MTQLRRCDSDRQRSEHRQYLHRGSYQLIGFLAARYAVVARGQLAIRFCPAMVHIATVLTK